MANLGDGINPGGGRVAVVGAGWAGMAAAVTLAEENVPVIVFEAARTLGGRARRVTLDGADFDNGQHVMLGAYREALRLMRTVGAQPERTLMRFPLELRYHDGFHLRAPRLPFPANLLAGLIRAKGLEFAQALSATRFVLGLRRRKFQIEPDRSVAQLLTEWNQTGRLRSHLWGPLCISALNTPLERASAQVFATVVRHGLAQSGSASDLLIALTDLTRLFPEPAADFVRRHGGSIQTGSPVRTIGAAPEGFTLDERAERHPGVIVACAPQHVAPLLSALPGLAGIRDQISALDYEPIATCYLRYDGKVSLPAPMLGFTGGLVQWVFDRTRPEERERTSVLAAVISGSGPHQDLERNELAARIDGELRSAYPTLPSLRSRQIIWEKRATFSCRPSLARPATRTPLPGLFLAGDYVAGPYPATLEAAVRSGVEAARLMSLRLKETLRNTQ